MPERLKRMTCFGRAALPNRSSIFPYQLKIRLIDYDQEMEDFCNQSFNHNWAVDIHIPHQFRKNKFAAASIVAYYIMFFSTEADAVLFKITYPSAEAGHV